MTKAPGGGAPGAFAVPGGQNPPESQLDDDEDEDDPESDEEQDEEDPLVGPLS